MQQICTKYNFPYTIRFINTKLCSYGCDSIRFINYQLVELCLNILVCICICLFESIVCNLKSK